MKPYPKYKDSEVEWIGEIPVDWKTARLRWFAKIFSGGTPSTDNLEYWENGSIPWINSGTVNQKIITQPSHYITEEALKNSSAKWISKNSIVIALAGQGKTKGMVAFLDIDTTCNQSMAAICPNKEIFSKYLFYYLDSKYNEIRGLAGDSQRDGLNLEMISQIQFPLPEVSEQKAIASFLDKKTKEIDELITAKEELIKKLEAQRKAIINEAVTGQAYKTGLIPSPDGKPVKFKDSGIDWLGEIPENWEVKKLKYIKDKSPNSFVDGPFGSNLKSEHYIEDGEVLVVESGFITSGKFKEKKFKTISEAHYETIKRSSCKVGDIIISKIGANYGMSGILPELAKKAVVSGNSLKLTVNDILFSNKFIQIQLLSLKYRGTFELIVNATAQPALSLGIMNNIILSVPNNKKEQNYLVDFIENKINDIDSLIDSIGSSIDELKKYKQSLISEAVTGKIDVRNWQKD